MSSDEEDELEDDLHRDEDSPATSPSSSPAPVVDTESKKDEPASVTPDPSSQSRRPPNREDSDNLDEKMAGMQMKDKEDGKDDDT